MSRFVSMLALLSVASPAAAGGMAASLGEARQQALEASWSSGLDSELTSPVQRVVAILEKMQAQLEAEADAESETYDQVVCWCETNEKEKSQAVSAADLSLMSLESDIGERSGHGGTLSAQIAELKEQITADQSSLKTATSIREKESAEFTTEEKEMMQAVTNLKNAIAVLAKHQGGAASLLEVDAPQLASLRSVLSDVSTKYDLMLGGSRSRRSSGLAMLSVGTSQADRRSLGSALREMLGSSGDNGALPLNLAEHDLAAAAPVAKANGVFMQASGSQPNYQSYAARSSNIYGLLMQMKDEFEANLSEAQKAEMKAKEDFEALKASKQAQITAGKDKLDSLEAERAETQKALADSKQEFEATGKQRSADVEFLRNLKLTCQGLDSQWKDRSSMRSEELKAVAEALAVLKEDENFHHLYKTVSLLQEDSATDSATRAMRVRAAAALRRAAATPALAADDLLAAWRSRSGAARAPHAQLATLAVSVELDSFKEVKELMDKMIVQLKEQQAEEVDAKDHCVAEFSENEKTVAAKSQEKGDLEDKLDTLAKTLNNLEAGIESDKAELSDTEKAIKKASEAREKENAEFQTTVADQRATQEILKKALARLEAFYKKGSKAALLQRSSRISQTPPKKFTEYKKNSGSSTVMGLLEQIVEDSKKLETEATQGEKDAQAAYESFVKSSNAVIADLQQAITQKSKGVATATMDSEETKSDHTGVVGELESLEEYRADLHLQCDFLVKNFDIRQSARLEEMQAIQDAKAILSGSAQA
eukprot:CAMPEP_0170610630 /NCGR_PEP_ID=MMETSP0224-20130122/22762_1 /TAXON_ID=285029 /ORGANISM="Togula jolla, Strain CCCM 725" /LENGTH=767 /DNA_ID=CAMNT_0010936019 /DNA_START=35 /DNA_END=2338 /DNA_ORIENTATION=+